MEFDIAHCVSLPKLSGNSNNRSNGGSVGRIPRITAKGKIIFQPAPSLPRQPYLIILYIVTSRRSYTLLSHQIQLPSGYISPQSRQDTSHRCTDLPSLLSPTLSSWQRLIVELILFLFHIDCRTTWTPNYQIQALTPTVDPHRIDIPFILG